MHRVAKFWGWKKGANKYRAKKTEYGGQRYDSGLEAKVAADLDYRLKAGDITEIRRQVDFPLVVNGLKITTYRADFVITHPDGTFEVVEAKGMELPVFRMKFRLMEALHPEIKLTMVRR